MRALVLLALTLLAALPLAAPSASAYHVTCGATNPFPASPVGGEAGRAYTFATGTTWGATVFAFFTTCRVADQGIHTVNAQCVFLIGRPCLP